LKKQFTLPNFYISGMLKKYMAAMHFLHYTIPN